MIDLATLLLFAAACVALILTPGPDMAHALARSVAQGRCAGFAALIGIVLGSSVHGVLGAVGLSEVFRASPLAYEIVRYAGAAYLVWLAWQAFTSPDAVLSLSLRGRESFWPIVRAGLLTNLLNPKVALFYLAFVPQFIAPSAGPIWLQFLILAAVLNVLTLLLVGALVLGAGAAGTWLNARPTVRRLQRYVLGTVFGALAVRMAWPERT